MKVHGVYLYLYMPVPIPHLTWSGTRKLNSTAVCTGRCTRNGKPICCTAISYFHLLYNIQYRIYIIYMYICICICYTISCSKWKCITIYIYNIYLYKYRLHIDSDENLWIYMCRKYVFFVMTFYSWS